MHGRNGFRIVFLISPSLFLLFPISILTFILERIAHVLFTAQTTRDWRYGDSHITLYGPFNGTTSTYTDVDISINNAPTIAVDFLAVAAYIVSVLGFCGIVELRRVEGTSRHQRAWSWTVLLCNFAITATSIAVLGWIIALQGSEKGWKTLTDVNEHQEKWTRETWVCQIDELFPGNDWAGPACGLAKASRFMLIPLAISSALSILCAWVLVNERGGVKWLFGGKGRYGGFENLYEMYSRPTGYRTSAVHERSAPR